MNEGIFENVVRFRMHKSLPKTRPLHNNAWDNKGGNATPATPATATPATAHSIHCPPANAAPTPQCGSVNTNGN